MILYRYNYINFTRGSKSWMSVARKGVKGQGTRKGAFGFCKSIVLQLKQKKPPSFDSGFGDFNRI